MTKKIIFILIIFISSFLIFNLMEFELLNQSMNKYLQSLIFSTVLVLSLFQPKLRIKFIFTALFLIFAVILLYLMNQLSLSNALASIVIGIITIVSFTYLPQLAKKGFIEKL